MPSPSEQSKIRASAHPSEIDEDTIVVATKIVFSPSPSYSDVLQEYGPARPNHQHNAPSSLDAASETSTPSLGPRRGSFASEIPHGHSIPNPVRDTPPDRETRQHVHSGRSINNADLFTTLSEELAPKSGFLPSQISDVASQDEILTDSDPEFKSSTPMTMPPRSIDASSSNGAVPPPPQGYYNTYRLETTPSMPPPRREVTTSARRVKNYTLADGTVVSGKGLGRGRPGIKRGPRNPKYSMIDSNTLADSPSTSEQQSPAMMTPPVKRRKRALTNTSDVHLPMSRSGSLTSGSRDSSPEYNPTDSTRSGRKVQKPPSALNRIDPGRLTRDGPMKLERNASSTASPSAIKSHPKIKRRMYRGREQLALCEHCLRGHGPSGNVIVFCDACNKCWHQRCHEPQVPQSTVSDSKAEWYCADCDRILHGKKSKKQAAAAAAVKQQANAVPTPAFAGPLIGGSTLTNAQKQNYLQSLSKEKLVSLILSASELAPALPLFQAPTPAPSPLPLAKFTSNYTTPVTSTFQPPTPVGPEEDEGYDSYFDDHAYLYPKPGQGIKLPPESSDLHMLLEGKDSRTFSHWVRGMVGREHSGSGDVQGVVQVNGHAHG